MNQRLFFCFLIIGLCEVAFSQRGGSSRTPSRPSSSRPASRPRSPSIGPGSRQVETTPRPGSDEDRPTGPACKTGSGQSGTCQHLSACVFQFDDLDVLERSTCKGEDGIDGVCCTATNPKATESLPVPQATGRRRASGGPDISRNDVDISGRRVLNEMNKDLETLEKELVQRGLVVRAGSTEAFHQAFFGDKSQAQNIGRDGNVLLQTTSELARRLNISSVQTRRGLSGRFNLSDSVVSRSCPRPPRCDSTKYRSFDGSCNNRQFPNWGKSFVAFNRFLESDYADGISAPRVASDGGHLPSGRAVSTAGTPDADVPNNFYSLGIMQWAQFLDHDFSLASITKIRTGEGIRCCDPEILANPRLRHPACFPIQIPKDDQFFSRHGQTCMEFVRSMPAPSQDCFIGSKETLNQLTSFIDASQVYGSREEETRRLREFKGGRLRSMNYNSKQLLPSDNVTQCVQRPVDISCFMAGDERVNEQISLATMHTLWLREHNRIAQGLSEINPGWNDEIVFQETRRIVAAQIQHITYNEFLPLLLGRKVMRAFRLLLQPYGYSNAYDPTVNPTIGNGFASAAYRYGHTLVQGKVNLLEENGKVAQSVPLRTQFFNPGLIYEPGNFDRLVRGLAGQPAQTFDRFVTDQLTNHLFQEPNKKFGLDLIALNIQRARDNGIPGYNQWREYCSLGKVRNFQELGQIMNPHSVRAFQKLYRSVDDIDLFPAGVAEISLPGATLGPTFACVAGEQFRRLKVGDRFWYENGGQESSFTPRQLQEIRRTSLARIYCENSDNIQGIQPLALLQPMIWNPKIPCNSRNIPKMRLGAWRNEPVWS